MAIFPASEVTRIADQLERSFRGGAWHGPATREALAGVDAAAAGRRPAPAAHTIAELVRHITFWMDAARHRITGDGDVDAALDWPQDEPATDEAWSSAVSELDEAYEGLRAAILELDDARLDDPVPGTDPTVRGLLLGTLQHNAYHTGQIVQIRQGVST